MGECKICAAGKILIRGCGNFNRHSYKADGYI